MAITGAIFDCDATLLDAVPMWKETIPRVLGRYTDKDLETHIQASITTPLDTAMHNFIVNFQPDVSEEELLRVVKEEVRKGYIHRTSVYPDMLAILAELKEAHIPMAVASCTSKTELLAALNAHHLLPFFDRVFSAADGYPGKEKPNVFNAAQEALGTSRDTTWVFEDSPTAARTARDAGFKVVGLIREHNWLDTTCLQEIAHIAKREDEPYITYKELAEYAE